MIAVHFHSVLQTVDMDDCAPQDGTMGVVRQRPGVTNKQPAPPPSAPAKVVRKPGNRRSSLMSEPLGSTEPGLIPDFFKAVLDLASRSKTPSTEPSSTAYSRVHPSQRSQAGRRPSHSG